VLAGKRRGQQTAQGLTATAFGTHRRSHGVDPAEPWYEPSQAAFVPGSGPRLAACLRRECPHRAGVFETVTMFVGALAAGMGAVQAWTPGAANHRELAGTPRAGPMRWARLRGDRHAIVVRRRCDRDDGADMSGPAEAGGNSRAPSAPPNRPPTHQPGTAAPPAPLLPPAPPQPAHLESSVTDWSTPTQFVTDDPRRTQPGSNQYRHGRSTTDPTRQQPISSRTIREGLHAPWAWTRAGRK
jgi:hypothetical protein